MLRGYVRRSAIAVAAWLPFFAFWVLVALSTARTRPSAVLISSLITMGSAGLLAIAVWRACERWPFEFGLRFYLLQFFFAGIYSLAWMTAIYTLELVRRGSAPPGFWSGLSLVRQLFLGVWFYTLLAGMFHAVQTRNRLHEKERLAARAEALAAAARLDAIRARLNPHFLFNALHTLAALVKLRPALAESAIERLGDMLRYTLKEDGRDVVEFSEEYQFTRQYLAFEQLRYEDRLTVDLKIDPESFNFDVPAFSMQTLAENAVHHAIAVRPEGGSIWITSSCRDGHLEIAVRDNGPGAPADSRESHHFGLRSLRDRLTAAYGSAADLRIRTAAEGFEAILVVPTAADRGAESP